MKKMKKYSLIISILSSLFLIAFSVILEYIIIKISDKKDSIWMFSKIEIFNNILSDNIYNFPILNFTKDLKAIYLNYNYEFLLNHSTNNICEDGFKKCGILDTFGNIMCLNKNLPCPINEIIIDNKEKEKEYINNGYYSLKLNEIKNLYYTNNSIDKEIIIELKYSEKPPKLITEENFIIDEYIFKNITGKDYFNDSIPIDYKEYIINKINKKDNIDLSYKNISDNYYIKHYFGFENYELMNNFINYDYNSTLLFQYNSYKILYGFHIGFFIINAIMIIVSISTTIIDEIFNILGPLVSFNLVIFIFYSVISIIIYVNIIDYTDILANCKYLLSDQIKELFIFIRYEKLTMIYFHCFYFSYSLKIINIILIIYKYYNIEN